MCRYAALDRIPIFFVLPKRKRPFMVKRKGAGDELAPKGPSHPKCGARRHGLLCKPRTPLLAAPMAVLCRTAFPHLKARHSPGCKPERLSATPPCVPLRYALPDLLRIGSHPSSNSGGESKGEGPQSLPFVSFQGGATVFKRRSAAGGGRSEPLLRKRHDRRPVKAGNRNAVTV